jgi:hypothetical protein
VKTAAAYQRESAARKVAQFLAKWDAGEPADGADDVVDIVLDTLAEPSPEMLEAGREELNRAIPIGAGGVTSAYQRALARAIWRAMLERAER